MVTNAATRSQFLLGKTRTFSDTVVWRRNVVKRDEMTHDCSRHQTSLEEFSERESLPPTNVI